MKKTGKIQLVFKPTDTTKERNEVIVFNSRWQLVKAIWRACRSGAYKLYVFFDNV